MNKNYLIAIFLMLLSSTSFGQGQAMPEVGKKMPDFSLENVAYYKNSQVSSRDLRGKWLVLDFWSTACVACIESFPKVNSFHKEFKSELNWFMVGVPSENQAGFDRRDIEEFYEKWRARKNLEMPVAYDGDLAKQWDINSLPHIVIVDPVGVVRFITDGRDMTAEKFRSLMVGNTVSFYPKGGSAAERPQFDAGNLAENAPLLHRSVLTKWQGEAQMVGYDIDRYAGFPPKYWQNGWTVAMLPLHALYNYAYIGKWQWDFEDPLHGEFYPKPALEVRDTSPFEFDYTRDVGKGTYNYNLTIPATEVTEQRLMSLLQEDLKRAFKYEVSIEARQMPVLKLIEAKPGAVRKLTTKGGDKYATPGIHVAGYTFRNYPPRYLAASLCWYLPEKKQTPCVDDSGLSGHFDFTIEADMTDIEDVRRAIRKQGLDLVEGTREMKVLVIRDATDVPVR